MKRSLILCAAALLLSMPTTLEAQTLALVNATVWDGSSDPVEGQTLIVRRGVITAVGNSPAVPSGAEIIDVGGKLVTPGFIGMGTRIGLVEIGLEASTRDDAPLSGEVDAVRASFSAIDGFNPRSTLLGVARMGGITSVVSTPSGGLIGGTSAWVDLSLGRLASRVVERASALHVDLDDGGVSSAGGAMPAALGRLREVLEDARLFAREGRAYERRALREMGVSRHDLMRVAAALRGELPVVIRVSRADNIVRALDIAEEYGLDLILAGAEEGWMVAEEIAESEASVIVQPQSNMPSRFSRLASRYDNPTLLHAAGVELIITNFDAHGLHNLRQEAGNAVALGLPRNVALRALTSVPASALGDDERGRLGAGRVADLVVWSGDPFELSSVPERMFIRGVDTSMRSRQTALFERYRDLSNIRRGQAEIQGAASLTVVEPD